MRLAFLHPDLLNRPCSECKRFIYRDEPGRLSSVKLVMAPGLPPVPRPPGVATPCHECPKIPPGEEPRPENAIELSDRNWQALEHYKECRAVMRFPDDRIVRRNAAIIRAAEDEAFMDRAARMAHAIFKALVR